MFYVRLDHLDKGDDGASADKADKCSGLEGVDQDLKCLVNRSQHITDVAEVFGHLVDGRDIHIDFISQNTPPSTALVDRTKGVAERIGHTLDPFVGFVDDIGRVLQVGVQEAM